MSARTIETVLAENTALQEQIAKLTAEHDKANSDLSTATADRDQAHKIIVAITSERDAALASVKSLTTECDSLKAANEKLSGESRDFAAQVAAGVRALVIVPGKPGAAAEDKPKTLDQRCLEANAAKKAALKAA